MAQDNPDSPTYYYLSTTSKDVISEIGINGAPIIRDVEGEGIIVSEPVATWLIHGKNELTVKLTPLDDNKRNLNPTIKIQLFEHDPAFSVPTPKSILAEYNYPPNNADKKINLPTYDSRSFHIAENINTKLWKEASSLKKLSSDDKNEIIKVINSLENSLISKDISTAINLQRYKIVDDSIAEKKSYEKLESAAIKGYEWLNKQTGVVTNAITLDTAKFLICCNDMVIYVSRTNGEDAVQLESDDLYFDIAIYVSKINGKWVIVR